MKINNLLKYAILSAAAVVTLSACEDDVVVGKTTSPNHNVKDNVVYVTDDNGKRVYTTVDLRDTQDVPLYVNTPTTMSLPCDVAFTYDEKVLADYNAANGTDFEAIPEEWITLSNGGIATLPAGASVSEPMTLTITSDGSLDRTKSYAVPLRVAVNNGQVDVTKNSATRLVFVNDLTGVPATAATTYTDENGETKNFRVMSCMEVNDTNPLCTMTFTLKESGRMFYSGLMLFAANINVDAETGLPYINCNENVTAILGARDKYLKPLQDRGIKVYLSILGNHDHANTNNLAPETAVYYAKLIKDFCDAYQLDGVFYNTEYASYVNPAPAGYVSASNAAAAYLFYQVKKLQPNRDNIIYTYDFSSLPTITGDEGETVEPGDYMDYIWTNYGTSSLNVNNFPGVPKDQCGYYSFEMAQGRFSTSESNLKKMRDNGYGLHVHFAQDNTRSNFTSQLSAMTRCAKAFYNETLVWDGTTPRKDW